ncbi:transcriptional regulator [Acetobacter sicerae]|uniref:transcriptional regulator n=1 Tax=Acetobacter sicerae TaxID=85325 RepID=UPI0038D02917
MSHIPHMNVAEQIISRLGGTRSAAKLIGAPPSTIQAWKKRGRIPSGRVCEVEAATNIPREELRPDLFRREEAQQ